MDSSKMNPYDKLFICCVAGGFAATVRVLRRKSFRRKQIAQIYI